MSATLLPRTSLSAHPVADSIQAFQRMTRSLRSRTTIPPLIASSRATASELALRDMGQGRSRPGRAVDERHQQFLQSRKRGQVEQHGDVPLNIALSNGKVDIDEQDAISSRGDASQREELRS